MLYRHLSNIGTVLKSINDGQGPDVIALTEVEDLHAAEKLTDQQLNNLGYQTIISMDGRDARGIENSLISKFSLWPGAAAKLVFADGLDSQRGVLRVELDAKGEHLIMYVNHWKSMRDGEAESVADNLKIAAAVKRDMEATLAQDPKARVVAMGDFNTKFENGDNSAVDALGASRDEKAASLLWDATQHIVDRVKEGVESPLLGLGSHEYNGNADFLDRALTSKNEGPLEFLPDSLVLMPRFPRFFGKPRDGQVVINPNGLSDHRAMFLKLKVRSVTLDDADGTTDSP
jgi:endonuclease/exonuclease/phosphatase family metal-dependent hydrolase